MDQKKLKIVFLSRYVGQINRGVESFVLELSQRLTNLFEVEILSGQKSDDLDKIIQNGYDLIIPTNGRMQAFKMSLGRFFGKYKILISGHAGVGRDDIWNIFFCKPDVYVALTDYEMNWAKNWAWGTKVVKIPNGIDLEKFKSAGKKININLPRPIILSVGALEWYKYHDLTIRALANLSVGSLLLIGQGSEEKKLTELGKKLLGEDRFKIISISYDQINRFYRSSDLFVLPSWDREAFGIVYLEAMASGLAVVAPDDSPRREIIGNAGILVDVADPVKYSVAIRKALARKWGNIPRKQAEKFSWEKVAGEYVKLIKEMFR